MKYLSMFTPAETLLLMQGSKAVYKELLKITFMDLLIRKYLKTSKRQYEPSPNTNLVTLTYVGRGPSYNTSGAYPHEMVFLETYLRSRTMNPLFHHAVRIGYQNSGSKNNYMRMIMEEAKIAKYVDRGFFFNWFGSFRINEEGRIVADAIKKELEELEHTLPDLLKNDKRKALEIIKKIRGNVFHLKNVDYKLLNEVDKELSAEMSKGGMDYGDAFGCSAVGCSSWESFDHHSDSFDSSCGTSDSGCSSSGCSSGCSSCGGGCGGGGD